MANEKGSLWLVIIIELDHQSDVSPPPAPSLHGPGDRPPLVLSSPAGLQLQVWLLVILPLPLVTMFYCRAREGLKTLRVEDDRPALNVGLIVPFSNFLKKQYEKSVGAAVSGIKKKSYSWSYIYNLDEYTIHTEMMSINPSPTGCFIAMLAKIFTSSFLSSHFYHLDYFINQCFPLGKLKLILFQRSKLTEGVNIMKSPFRKEIHFIGNKNLIKIPKFYC